MKPKVTQITGVLQTAGRRRQVVEISDGNYTIEETDHVVSIVGPLLVPIRLPFEAMQGTTIEIADGVGLASADPILISGNGQTIVFEHTSAERFEPRSVRVEPLDAERVIVLDGLASAKRLVVQGAELLNQIR
mgnify:CR=1 FL=1